LPIYFSINPIRFNGTAYTFVEITDSAKKHFGANSKKYFEYVVQHLDGQNWKESARGRDGHSEYLTASVTSSIKGINAESDYRETYFRIYPEEGKIQFFHGCSISKRQYEKAKNKMQLQFD
jgi:hypothetical protein